MSRYVVTELEGFLTRPSGGTQKGQPGLSCHVIDTLWNHRLVASYRTEDLNKRTRLDRFASVRVDLNKRTRLDRFASVRGSAREHAERLNAAHSREAVSPHSERTA